MDDDRVIRVLHLVNGEYWSGAERVQTLLGAYADRSGFAVEFLCLKDGLFHERASELGLNVTDVWMRGRHDVSVVWRIARIVRARQVDVIHTHTVRTNLIGRLVGQITGVPVISHIHSPSLRETDSRLKNLVNTSVDRVLSRLTAHYIAVSQSLGDELLEGGVSSERLTIIPNGIDVHAFEPGVGRESGRQALGLPANAAVVAMVGLFRPRKGAEVLLKAFPLIAWQVPEARLVMLGPAVDDEYRDSLIDLCEIQGIAGQVTFTGFRDDVSRLLPAFDAIAMPSLFGEGTPMALLEAMAAALPVVATPVEGMAEVIVPGVTGLLTPVEDHEVLAEKLIQVLADPELRHRLGAAGRARIEANYSAERMTRATEELYARLVERGRGGVPDTLPNQEVLQP